MKTPTQIVGRLLEDAPEDPEEIDTGDLLDFRTSDEDEENDEDRESPPVSGARAENPPEKINVKKALEKVFTPDIYGKHLMAALEEDYYVDEDPTEKFIAYAAKNHMPVDEAAALWDEIDTARDKYSFLKDDAVLDEIGYDTDDYWDYSDRYSGSADSDADFAEELFDSLGEEIPALLQGHIDWDGVAKDLMQDYQSIEGSDGTTYYFHY